MLPHLESTWGIDGLIAILTMVDGTTGTGTVTIATGATVVIGETETATATVTPTDGITGTGVTATGAARLLDEDTLLTTEGGGAILAAPRVEVALLVVGTMKLRQRMRMIRGGKPWSRFRVCVKGRRSRDAKENVVFKFGVPCSLKFLHSLRRSSDPISIAKKKLSSCQVIVISSCLVIVCVLAVFAYYYVCKYKKLLDPLTVLTDWRLPACP